MISYIYPDGCDNVIFKFIRATGSVGIITMTNDGVGKYLTLMVCIVELISTYKIINNSLRFFEDELSSQVQRFWVFCSQGIF